MSLIMNPLPPQAYTKDTLVQAYAWLQTQSDSVKEMATNPDILVSLFLKTKSQGDQFFERPSIQNFKNELKSLAGMMGEFELGGAPQSHLHQQNFAGSPASPPIQTPPIPAASSAMPTQGAPQSYAHFLAQQPAPSSPTTSSLMGEALVQKGGGPSALRHPPFTDNMPALAQPLLDEKSLEMIQEVKKSLNLTSDSEVLRLLLAIGYQKARQLYK